MDFIPYLMLLLAALAVAQKDTDIDEDYTEEIGDNRREIYLDRCSNLTEEEFPASLHTLALAECSRENLAAIDFDAVANLSVLRLRDGHIWTLHRERFVKLPHLQILELAGNSIHDVSYEAFTGLSQLWMLTLNQNGLSFLNGSVFHPLPELRHLDLSDNKLLGLATMLFAGSPKLEVLLIRNNRFMALWVEPFRVLKSLLLLDMRRSSIHLQKDMQLYSARTIRLENSSITQLEVLGEVSILQAGNSELKEVYLVVKNPVTELHLHANSLDTRGITELLRGMWRLQILDLSKNLVTELPVFSRTHFTGEVFMLPTLRFVNLSHNQLEHLHADSPLLSPTLTHLDVSHNRIHSIEPHTFDRMDHLQYLYLQGNLIRRIRSKIFYNPHPSLKEVAFYNNTIGYESYCGITKYLKEIGVHVLEKDPLGHHCVDSKKESLKNPSHKDSDASPQPGVHQASKELHTSRKWSTWDALILLSMLASLGLDVFLILQLRRSRAIRQPSQLTSVSLGN